MRNLKTFRKESESFPFASLISGSCQKLRKVINRAENHYELLQSAYILALRSTPHRITLESLIPVGKIFWICIPLYDNKLFISFYRAKVYDTGLIRTLRSGRSREGYIWVVRLDLPSPSIVTSPCLESVGDAIEGSIQEHCSLSRNSR